MLAPLRAVAGEGSDASEDLRLRPRTNPPFQAGEEGGRRWGTREEGTP